MSGTGHGLIMAWLPDPIEFFKVNERELTTLIEHQCDRFDVPAEHRKDIVQEFLFRVVTGHYKYDPSYKGRDDQASSVTTYLFSCSRYFVMSYLKKHAEEREKMAEVRKGTSLRVESMRYQNRGRDDLHLDLERFLDLVDMYPHAPRKRSCNVRDMFRDSMLMVAEGYTGVEVARKHGISNVYLSYVRSFLRDLWKEVNDVVDGGDGDLRMWESGDGEFRVRGRVCSRPYNVSSKRASAHHG